MRVLNSLVILLLWMSVGNSASVETQAPLPEDFDQEIEAPGVGKIRLEYRDVGEPVSEPSYLEIYAKCDGFVKEKRILKIGMCHIKSHKYEKETKTLKLEYVTSEVAVGSVVRCVHNTEKQVDLGKACTELHREKLKKNPNTN
jgi:hypothetical protein